MAISQRMAQIQATIDSLATRTTSARSTASASAFGLVLDREVAATSAVTQAGATAGATALNADGVPADLAAYGNGKIPASALSQVGSTGERLWAPAAASMDRLLAAAKKDGVTISITDSYRSYDSQVALAKEKGLYSQGGLAAAPGTSDHGWGQSVDLRLDSDAQAWMRANGATYGFTENVRREPWHWTYAAS